MWFDSTFVVTFGNVMSAGTSKIKAIKDGKQVEFAKRVNIQIDKNHINGVTTRGKIVMTPHGFILDNDKALKAYKDDQADAWKAILGGGDFIIAEEDQAYEGHLQPTLKNHNKLWTKKNYLSSSITSKSKAQRLLKQTEY